ncbi:MAG: hypothetical protein JSR48_02585 [Verrucomicrobia bacterium]|nr:hypothetical protein [Verrucomicrobiota bacterium]
MRIRACQILLATLLLLTAGPLRAQVLWSGTTAGMSPGQVRQVVPEAAPTNEADALKLPGERGVEKLTADEVTVAGQTFRVRFYFKDDRLVHVSLAESGEVPAKEFEKFRALLRGKYGMEQSTRSSEYIQVTWKIMATTITLTWVPQGRQKNTSSLTIAYESPIIKDSERL